jgi:hypothetical protein
MTSFPLFRLEPTRAAYAARLNNMRRPSGRFDMSAQVGGASYVAAAMEADWRSTIGGRVHVKTVDWWRVSLKTPDASTTYQTEMPAHKIIMNVSGLA